MRNLLESLVCPICKVFLSGEPNSLICKSCDVTYELKDGKPKFIFEVFETTDRIDLMKSLIKKYPKLYEALIEILSPVFPIHRLHVRRQLRKLDENWLIVNVGSGNTRLSKNIVNVDVINYEAVDLIADIKALPFASSSVDCLINIAVLEHVRQPELAVKEFHRVLKNGGIAYIYVPFMMGYHASPHDFTRWTSSGLEILFEEFRIDYRISVGPTSSMLWVMQEWLASLFAFNSKKLHDIILLLLMSISWPLKSLDYFLGKNAFATNTSAGFLFKLSKN